MIYALAVLAVAAVSFVIVRTGATALELTGLSRDAARFQALSAFFGVGFTTREAEMVVNHPVRRRIISHIIVVGNVGTLGAIGTIIVGAGTLDFSERHLESWGKVGLVFAGLFALWLLSRSYVVNKTVRWTVERMLRRTTVMHALDYEELLHVRHGFEVVEMALEPGHPMAGRSLREGRPREEGVTVLGLSRSDGSFVGAPGPDTRLKAGDTLIVYGNRAAIERFFDAGARSESPPQPPPPGPVHSPS